MNDTIKFDIPYVNKTAYWYNGSYTVVHGENGAGKTLFLNMLEQWCSDKGYGTVHYDAMTALSEFPYLLQNATDLELTTTCMIMAKFSMDFNDDVALWATAAGYDSDEYYDYMRNSDVLRTVMDRCGTGYTRMFVMIIKGIKSSTASYYLMDLPETSLHIMVARKIVTYLMTKFRNMKFVVATHSPEVVGGLSNTFKPEEDENIIGLYDE